MRFGCFLSCEEYTPAELVEQAKLAEQAGFEGLWISDHFHPWNDAQGQSPFVWSLIGAIAEATDLPVTTAVTCCQHCARSTVADADPPGSRRSPPTR